MLAQSDLSVVRRATLADEEELMSLCRLLWAENGVLTLDEDRVKGILQKCLNPNGGGIIGVIGKPGHIEGMICLIISQFWYSSDWILEELYSYIHPEHRKSPNARRLVAFAKAHATALDIPLFIGIISNTRTEAKVRLYRGELGQPAGAFFIHNMQWKDNTAPSPVNFWSEKGWRNPRGGKRVKQKVSA